MTREKHSLGKFDFTFTQAFSEDNWCPPHQWLAIFSDSEILLGMCVCVCVCVCVSIMKDWRGRRLEPNLASFKELKR